MALPMGKIGRRSYRTVKAENRRQKKTKNPPVWLYFCAGKLFHITLQDDTQWADQYKHKN